MARPKSRQPKHCHHKPSGRGFVILNGEWKYTGKWGTPEADDAYLRYLSEWISRGRVALPGGPGAASPAGHKLKVVLAAYWLHCQTKFTRADGTARGELQNIRDAMKVLVRLYGELAAADFTTDHMEVVRKEMIRAGNTRRYINRNVVRIVAAFKWAMLRKYVPVTVHHALSCLPQLAPGDDGVREAPAVEPVPADRVAAVMDCLPSPVRAMVELQLITAARPGELCALRIRDVDRTNPDLWEAHLKEHKTAHKGKARALFFNREAQKLLTPFLQFDPDAYWFSPRRAMAEHQRARRETRKSKVTPSQERRHLLAQRRNKARPPRDHYETKTYARAIVRACEIAMGMPDELRKTSRRPDGKGPAAVAAWIEAERRRRALAKEWRRKYTWSPGQLRHNAATALEAAHGLEKASKVMGHATARTTLIYAKQTFDVAREIMRGRVKESI